MLKTTEADRSKVLAAHTRYENIFHEFCEDGFCIVCLAMDDIDTLLAEVERLRGLLMKYGKHTEVCRSNFPEYRGVPHDCTCGYAAALTGGPAPRKENANE